MSAGSINQHNPSIFNFFDFNENSPLVLQPNEATATTQKTVSAAKNTVTLEEADHIIKNLDNRKIEKLKIDDKNSLRMMKKFIFVAFVVAITALVLILTINPTTWLFGVLLIVSAFSAKAGLATFLTLAWEIWNAEDRIKEIEASVHCNSEKFSEIFKRAIKLKEKNDDVILQKTFLEWKETQKYFFKL